MINITIVGAGLSGTLAAMNLLQSRSDDNINIKLIDSCNEQDLGPAFSTDEDYLLNVPAGMMGAAADEPEHFWEWLQEKGIPAQKTDFIKRRIYREYVKEIFNNALSGRKTNISYERIQDEVTDIQTDGSKAIVFLGSGKKTEADKVVLALGNFPPRNLSLENDSYLNSLNYIQNPWNSGFLSSLSKDAEVFIIGTGQTTVDIAAGLHRRTHNGKIFAVSRHGFMPMVHKTVDVYPQFYDELKDLKSVLELCRVIRRHINKAENAGYDIRAVIDSLRPYTQELWMNLPREEKLKFLRHLFRWWEIIRSRIPKESDAIIKQMKSSGQLNIIAGNITGIDVKEKYLLVNYILRNSGRQINQRADLVINCIGPEHDYGRINTPLVKNLVGRGIIQPDPVRLGINALPDGSLIYKDGSVSKVFYTLGFPLRGILWETLAAPEIRDQAKKLAILLTS